MRMRRSDKREQFDELKAMTQILAIGVQNSIATTMCSNRNQRRRQEGSCNYG